MPVAVLVVDSVNRKPTPNEPGVADKLRLAAPPTEFGVADVKLTDPDVRGSTFDIQPGGRVTMRGMPMRELPPLAWNLPPDLIIGLPGWANTDRYDLLAKAELPNGQRLSQDELAPMFQAFLKDRFKLVAHMEQRPMNAYIRL